MSDPVQTLDTCNTLLRTEIATVEAYTAVLRRFHGKSKNGILECIRADHQVNAARLQQFISECGVLPAKSSGWCLGIVVVAKSIAAICGESLVIHFLQTVERCSSTRYEEALVSPDIANVAKRLIRNGLLPTILPHQRALQVHQQYYSSSVR